MKKSERERETGWRLVGNLGEQKGQIRYRVGKQEALTFPSLLWSQGKSRGSGVWRMGWGGGLERAWGGGGQEGGPGRTSGPPDSHHLCLPLPASPVTSGGGHTTLRVMDAKRPGQLS